MNDDPRPVALILGAAVWPGGRPSITLRRRSEHGARLWLDGSVRALVACGGEGRHPPREAQVISELCQGLGVPEAAIMQEGQSTSTEENIRFALPLLESLGASQVVIVTDRYHAPRARLIARRLGLLVTSSSPAIPQGRRKHVVKQTLREVPAYLWYWILKR